MKTITIITDEQGRLTGLIVPEGTCAQVVNGPNENNEHETFYRYEPNNDSGLAKTVPTGYRSRTGMTNHDILVTG